jgi:uncharacterized alpha-E superfamily protein
MTAMLDPSQLRKLSYETASGQARPMLSRDADSMYWMARYVERAEHVARLLRVHQILLVDVGDLTPVLEHQMWLTILATTRSGGEPEGDGTIASRIGKFMTFDHANPSSIVSCIAKARENARAIRENISSEMWECLNTIYWAVTADEAKSRYDESPDEFLYGIMNGSMLFQGLTDATLAHDQRWHFANAAKYLERIEVTARVIETRFNVLAKMDAQLDQPIRNIHLMGVLRRCCSLEAYRRLHMADLDATNIAAFLVLQKDYPRSIRFCVDQLHCAVQGVRVSNGQHTPSPPERIVGRLGAQLEYASIDEILGEGLTQYLAKIEAVVDESAVSLQKSYFLY